MTDIRELITELEKAKEDYEEALREENKARSFCCNALNRLNGVQKSIDKWYTEQKSVASPQSDWKREAAVRIPMGSKKEFN